MATIQVLGSSSAGNAYILRCEHSLLLIECGISYKNVLRAIGGNVDLFCGCLVTHRHTDHAKHIKEFTDRRFKVYSCKDVSEHYDRVSVLEPYKAYKIGEFIVKPIPAFHSVECYAYQIEHKEFGKLIFATDTFKFPYIFPKVNHIMVEANYDEELYIENFENNRSQSNNHFEISNCVEFLSKNNNEELKNIILLHLSDGNSDEKMFVSRVVDGVGFGNVQVADKGRIFEL